MSQLHRLKKYVISGIKKRGSCGIKWGKGLFFVEGMGDHWVALFQVPPPPTHTTTFEKNPLVETWLQKMKFLHEKNLFRGFRPNFFKKIWVHPTPPNPTLREITPGGKIHKVHIRRVSVRGPYIFYVIPSRGGAQGKFHLLRFLYPPTLLTTRPNITSP